KRQRIHTFIATSAIHVEKKLKMTEEDVIEQVKKYVSLARNYCEDVEFSPEDAGRTDIDFLCKVVEIAIRSGATTINIPDTVGYTIPEVFAKIIDNLFNRVPNIDKAVISVHCHDDLGMATANSITAISHGARQVECTINGIGERAGNAALEEIVMTLAVRKDVFGVTTKVNTKEIMRTSKLVREICAMPVQPNKAIVGANAFAHSSGIHQDGVLKSKRTYEIMTPQSIGLKEARMNLTSRSGSHMVKARLLELGYKEDDFDIDSIYPKFKELADKKGRVYDDDLIALVEAKNSDELKDVFALEYLNVSSGKGIIPTATARVLVDGKKVREEAASGDGAFDATKKAIDRITGFNITIESYRLEAVTEGQEAQGRVVIVGRAEEGTFTGTATSTDIVEASALAYMDIVNKIARMKKFNKKIPVRDVELL
ncbi:MAG: 2-isopropylmalate synthase, partial [Chitinispirillaceae bacterium]|nr:2-isopropylmalate synthase [Chitinispirillaceae bacterium]